MISQNSVAVLISFQGYTAVGGTNWVDVVTTVYNKSLVLTYNYAYGGATINASLVAPYESTVLSLTDQVNEFLATAATKPASTPWTSADSLFSIWIGINDIGNSYGNSGETAFCDTLLNAEFALVQELVSPRFCRSAARSNLNPGSMVVRTIPLIVMRFMFNSFVQ